MVVFSVKLDEGGAYGPFDGDKTVMYNSVITNKDGAYSIDTGVFTAPFSGVYYFTFFYRGGKKKVASLELMKNDQPVVMTSDVKPEDADNGGNAAFLELMTGDRVAVRLSAGAAVSASGGHTTFSGFLVNSS